ncbi:hypothetical protein ASAC_0740 [Acidilobus saccharovorans 345-15]|uniref:MoaD/ThiS family protein n=1 Tax=Acidilobus saccharovorans (strain DSM 16705 / JCM 18335 / VKM B-2471 / 345-15) TaxID=666510 RepID=D9Q1F8_ACIS3|nr:MoaD/ThiS family protein [Acidilobus saccharovorans]ADL19146.1 hypothetical protein ASAC_0740 [Acidilobus saccharovorans 345-15]
MKVNVMYGGELASMAGVSRETVELQEGSTLSDLLAYIERAHGRRLLEALGNRLLLLVNGRSVKPSEVSSLRLSEGDFVSLLPPVLGGLRGRTV